MLIYRNISLKHYNTFGLDYLANCMLHLRSVREASALFKEGSSFVKPLLILGGGSNMLFTDSFSGTILYPDFRGIRIDKKSGDGVIISAGAGIAWDRLVEWSVEKGLGGLENLSLIPGKVGAVPVQNIGAYGVEVKDCIEKVKAINIEDGTTRTFSNNDCEFGYRSSVFKSRLKGKYMITRVWFRLSSKPAFNLEYGSLKDEVDKLGSVTLRNVRNAVINIRRSKLPDPEVIGNAGSFFKNPVADTSLVLKLKRSYPEMPVYADTCEKTKIAAGWLIEQCGWKGKRKGDAGVHEKQALVLVNHGKATGKEILDLSEEIRKSVRVKFGINLEREVEVI